MDFEHWYNVEEDKENMINTQRKLSVPHQLA
jgi:hypothetical protein